MKKLLFFIVVCLAIIPQQLMAVPAYPVKRIVQLMDNSIVELTLHGDEDFHYWQAGDGRVFIEKKDQYIQMKTDEVNEIWNANRKVRGEVYKHYNSSSAAKVKRRANTYMGKKKGLVILVNFTDIKMSESDPKTYFTDFFNKANYTDGGFTGSVHDYFNDQSYGKFDLEFDVVGPVEAKYQSAYYGQNSEDGKSIDIKVQELIPEVCKAVNDQVNFKDYDWDDDGTVDQVFIIYAGYGENYGAPSETIWPHESNISGQGLKLDGCNIANYAVSCELSGTSGSRPEGIGTACHEFSHCLGLMDMYDTSYSGGWGTGNWDLLCSGSYNNNSCTPPSFTSYERMFCGWLEPKELSNQTSVSALKYIGDEPDAYIMRNGGKADEYYLLENRQISKWDAPLKAHGLLVVHVDYDENVWNTNTINNNVNHQHMTIIPADGSLSTSTINGDTYPGTSGNTSLSKYSTPSASVFNNNTDGTKYMNKNVLDIQENSDGVVSFVACVPELETPVLKDATEVGAGAFSISWDSVSGADEYEIEVSEFTKSEKTIEESLIIDEDFSKCYSKSAGFTDISSKLANYLNTSGFAGSKLYCSPYYLKIGTTSAKGYIYTPYFYVRESGKLTYAIRVSLLDQSTPVDASIVHYVSGSDNSSVDFTISEDGWIVDNATQITDEMRFGFFPEGPVYVNHLCVYEGEWSKEDIIASTKLKAPRKAISHNYTTKDNSYTFTDMNVSSTYYIKVKALNKYLNSIWSDEKPFAFSAASINDARTNTDNSISSTEYYDVYGQKTSSSSKGIIIKKVKNADGSVIVKKIFKK